MRPSFRFGQDPPRPLDDRQVDHLAVERDRAAALALALARPRRPRAAPTRRSSASGAKTRLTIATCAGWMQALPRKPSERAKRAAASSPASSRVSRWTTSNGAADPGRGRVDDDLRAGVEDLEPVRPRLEPELGAEVDGAEQQRGDPGARRGLVGEPQALRRLDDRDHGRAGRRRARRPRRASPSAARPRRGRARATAREVVLEPGRAGAVDADDRRRGRRSDELAGRVLRGGRDRVLEVGDDARRRPEASALASLRSSVPGAKRSERRWASGGRGACMSDIRERVKRVVPGCLTRLRKSDINAPLVVRAGRSRREGGRVPRVRRARTCSSSRRCPTRSPGPGEVLIDIAASRAQPPRRRRPRGRLALPGRAAVRPRGRGRRPDRGARRGRRGLAGRRPRDAVPDGHLRRLPLLPHRPRVALPRRRASSASRPPAATPSSSPARRGT